MKDSVESENKTLKGCRKHWHAWHDITKHYKLSFKVGTSLIMKSTTLVGTRHIYDYEHIIYSMPHAFNMHKYNTLGG